MPGHLKKTGIILTLLQRQYQCLRAAGAMTELTHLPVQFDRQRQTRQIQPNRLFCFYASVLPVKSRLYFYMNNRLSLYILSMEATHEHCT